MTTTDPRIAVSVCSDCGTVNHPAQHFGCTGCGAAGASLTPQSVPASGTVLATATIHRHRGPDWPGLPFLLADIALDAGPVLTAVATSAVPGDRVRGSVITGEGRDHLIFAPEKGDTNDASTPK